MEQGFGILNFLKSKELNDTQKNLVLVLAAYGIIQVLAQDLGIKTGKKQRDLVQKLPVQIALFFSAAYIVTGTIMLSVITLFIYYGLKYYYSKGETSKVCFESV